jgi:hypothetical protein
MLLAAFDERRPTGDVDPLAENISNDAETISRLIREILAIRVDDGVAFEPDGFRVAVIREADPSTGVRITVPASIARARHPLRIDVNIGDPVTPAPVEIAYPTLLGEPFEILGYPIETVLAEKVVTMVDRGDATTRERDFADVLILTRRHALNAAPSAKPSRRLEHTAARISVRLDRSWSSWHRRASPTGAIRRPQRIAAAHLKEAFNVAQVGTQRCKIIRRMLQVPLMAGATWWMQPRAVTIPSTPYSVLSVAADASEQIRDAFRKLMRRLHPDSRGTIPMTPEEQAQFEAVQHAWAEMDPPRRGVLMTAGPRVRSAAPDHRPAWLVAAARPVSGSSAFRDPGRWPQSDPRGRPLSFAVASRPSRFSSLTVLRRGPSSPGRRSLPAGRGRCSRGRCGSAAEAARAAQARRGCREACPDHPHIVFLLLIKQLRRWAARRVTT